MGESRPVSMALGSAHADRMRLESVQYPQDPAAGCDMSFKGGDVR